MPIIGEDPQKCFKLFNRHVRQLVAATLHKTAHVFGTQTGDDRFVIEFSDTAVPLKTRKHYGTIHVHLSQSLWAEKRTDADKNEFYVLRTQQYWYSIQSSPDLKAKADLRWEYNTNTKRDSYCRHHAHINATAPLSIGDMDLDKVHLPTGWVTLEEVIRFLIYELGVSPPCGTDWPKRLADSEKKFYEEYTTKRYKGPKG